MVMLKSNKHSNQAGFGHALEFLLILGVLAVIVFVGMKVFNKKKDDTSQKNQASSDQACPNNKAGLLTTSPVKPDQVSTIIPLGNFAPPGHILPTGHMYYNYLNVGAKTNPVPALTNIYAPANMTVTAVTLFENGTANTPFNSYRLDFSVCDQVTGYFIHMITLNDSLKAAFHEPYDSTSTSGVGGSKVDHTYTKRVNISVKAGDVMGTGGGKAELPGGLDFGLIDKRAAMPTFANAKRWKDDSHYVCSLDYFPSDVSSALYKHIGDYNGVREPGDPKCGEVYQDKPGTAQGTWFEKGKVADDQLGAVQYHLTLGHSNFNHAKGVFSMGPDLTSLGFNVNVAYEFTPASSGQVDTDFSKVTPDGKTYCYNLVDQYDARNTIAALIQMPDKNTLKIAKSSSKTCSSSPQMGTTTLEYVR